MTEVLRVYRISMSERAKAQNSSSDNHSFVLFLCFKLINYLINYIYFSGRDESHASNMCIILNWPGISETIEKSHS